MATKMIGTVNGYVQSTCFVGGKRLSFDGTAKHLTQVAVRAGAKLGDEIKADFGGSGSQCNRYRMIAAPGDDRAGGFWADRIWSN